jgi:hypothetical protein
MAADYAFGVEPRRETRTRDGQDWVVGRESDVAWVRDGTADSVTICAAIPLVFEAYWTLELPYGDQEWSGPETDRIPAELVEVLTVQTTPQPWWLGFLNRWNGSDVIFDDAPTVALYNGGYVLVKAGPDQFRDWRGSPGDRIDERLPDLAFPQDRSWLTATLWDDEFTCFGGSRSLLEAFATHPLFSPWMRSVATDQDVRPPGQRQH